jgi:hypothetical protein
VPTCESVDDSSVGDSDWLSRAHPDEESAARHVIIAIAYLMETSTMKRLPSPLARVKLVAVPAGTREPGGAARRLGAEGL